MPVLVLEIDASKATAGAAEFGRATDDVQRRAARTAASIDGTETAVKDLGEAAKRAAAEAKALDTAMEETARAAVKQARGHKESGDAMGFAAKAAEFLEGKLKKIATLGPQILAADLLARVFGFSSAMGALDAVLDTVAKGIRDVATGLFDLSDPFEQQRKSVDSARASLDEYIKSLKAANDAKYGTIDFGVGQLNVSEALRNDPRFALERLRFQQRIDAVPKTSQVPFVDPRIGTITHYDTYNRPASEIQKDYDQLFQQLKLHIRALENVVSGENQRISAGGIPEQYSSISGGTSVPASRIFRSGSQGAAIFGPGSSELLAAGLDAAGRALPTFVASLFDAAHKMQLVDDSRFRYAGQGTGLLAGPGFNLAGRGLQAFGRFATPLLLNGPGGTGTTYSSGALKDEGLRTSLAGDLSSALDLANLKTRTFAQTLHSFADDLEQSILRKFVTGPLAEFFGNSLGGALGSANGNVFAGGRVIPFAGGGVVSSKSYFPLDTGLGSIAENGPEAIMPLKRGRNGQLGVQSEGGGGMVVNFHFHGPVDSRGMQQSTRQAAEDFKRRLG